MTVTVKSSRKVIVGSGWANPLTHDFMLENASYVHVYADDVELVGGVDYVVSDVGNVAGYTITIVTPGSWAPTNWVLDVVMPIDQEKDLTLGGTFGGKFEEGLDKQARRMQYIYDRARRGLKTSLSTAVGDNDLTLPAPEADKIIGWNDAGDDLENKTALELGAVTNVDEIGMPHISAGYTKRILEVNAASNGYDLVPLARATTPPGIVLGDNTPAVAAANRAAIQTVLDATGPGDVIMLPNGPIYIAGAGLQMFNGQMLSGLSPSGSIFGGTVLPGTALLWAGSAAEPYMIAFGANPASAPGTTQVFGGGLANLQVDGSYNVDKVLRFAACAHARFNNVKSMRPTISNSGRAVWWGANPTVVGLENTIRECDFSNIGAFAYGDAHAFFNQSNGAEGGLTFCSGHRLRADFGYGNGAGHGFYFSSMDDCTFLGVTGGRAAGGTGQGLYLNGNGVSGVVCVGNTFGMVKLSGGCPVLADGQHSNQNKIYGLSGVDELPVVIESNDGWVDVEYLGNQYGAAQTPGSVSQQPTTIRRKDTTTAGISRLLTLTHDLNPGAAAPGVGIGVEQVFEALTSAGLKKLLAAIRAATTNVGVGTEAATLTLQALTGGALVDVLALSQGRATVLSFDAGAGVGPIVEMFRDSASPAVSDGLGYLLFTGRSSAGTKRTYVDAFATILDATDGSEDAQLTVRAMLNGTLSNLATFRTNQTIFVGDLLPPSNDGGALGAGATAWSDLFLANGAVINFNNGNYTITHTAGTLTFSGIVVASQFNVGANKVVGARDTGWTAMTGTGSKGALAAAAAGTASGAYVQAELQGALNRIAALEARLRSLDAALITHGLIGP